MRHSSLRHPVAVLRQITGLTQPAFAEIVLIPAGTLAKIESRHLPLSRENAQRISDNTGAAAAWLLAGDASKPPTLDAGRPESLSASAPFTRESFERHRARIEPNGSGGTFSLRAVHAELEAVAAAVKGGEQESLFRYKINKAVKALQREFGRSEEERMRQERMHQALARCDQELAGSLSDLEKAATAIRPKRLQPLLRCLTEYARAKSDELS